MSINGPLGPEDQARFADASDADLVEAFRAGDAPGQIVMGRLLGKIGLTHRAEETLVRADGSQLLGEAGEPLLAVDYLAVADQHPGASATILNYVRMPETDERFPKMTKVMETVVKGYLPPEPPTNPYL